MLQLTRNLFKIPKNFLLIRFNHYKALGLTPSATQSEIKSAYYKLSKLHHPDKNNGSEESAKKFRAITAAYEILGKEDSRRRYDLENVAKPKPNTDYNMDLDLNFDFYGRNLNFERKFKKYRPKKKRKKIHRRFKKGFNRFHFQDIIFSGLLLSLFMWTNILFCESKTFLCI